ncbi:hypothetical protein SELMODRAFT_419049 [Selaginella moellendorffii]|uniref:Germin-like protein n=1 Tax=Selaginella moellendorffii TaxID=88036 RepID=D8S7N6_SELML|nr:hypothetical protein SELMODRAFT_419049 [Selaginella moellendorffii]
MRKRANEFLTIRKDLERRKKKELKVENDHQQEKVDAQIISSDFKTRPPSLEFLCSRMASSLQVLLVFFSVLADSTDPDSLQDYCLLTQEQQHQCKSSPSPSDFVSKVLGNTTNTRPPQTWNATLLSSANFPALNTMDLTIARAELGVGGTVPLHYHPRASELVFIVEGVVEVGFVDTSNVLFIQTLQPGDVTIVPKGMLHYEYNPGSSRATLLAYS